MNFFVTLDNLLNRLYYYCGIAAAFFIALIAVLVIVSIGARLLGVFVPGMTESAGYCLAISGSLGLAYTFGQRGHIRVEMLIGRLRSKVRFWVEMFVLLSATGFSSYLAFYLLKMVVVSHDFGDRSDGSDEMLIWIPQAPMALGFTLFAICLFHAFVKAMVTRNIDHLQSASDAAH